MQGNTIKNFQKIPVKKLTRKKLLFKCQNFDIIRKANRRVKQKMQEGFYG